jgi:multicomponent Na+:H+ antiporter subunit B
LKFFGLIAVIIVGVLLLLATGDFPAFGDSESPASEGELSSHYIENTIHDTKVPNMVTAVLADYRGFDTMFETVVIFVAGIGIIAVLRVFSDTANPMPEPPPAKPDSDDLIVRMTCSLVLPVIQLFALYVVAHGHHSPGGGFQGGVMLGASYILLALACGLPTAMKHLGERKTIVLAVIGIIIYSGWGLACLLFGGNLLDYAALDGIIPQDEQMARSHSMLGVEIGVAFTVTAIMFSIYANLSTRGRLANGL